MGFRIVFGLKSVTHTNDQCSRLVMDPLELMKREMLRRKLSHKTMTTYLFYCRKFLLYCKDKDLKRISKVDLKDFVDSLVDKGFSGNSLNVALNSVKFLFENVLRKSSKVKIKYSKVPRRAPGFLSKEEVMRVISCIGNEKQRLIVSLMYGAGLRVSEVVKLKKQDLEIREGFGWVREGKGKKDRPFIIPEKTREELICLVKGLRDFDYLFPGQKGLYYSSRSVQEIVKRAARLAGIKKKVHPHVFRHSFATHLLEAGNDIIVVQALLGHSEARTTMNYLHAVKPRMLSVKSPLD